MAQELEELVKRARKIQMTPGQVAAQRQSFAYGNTHIENDSITREMVAEADRKLSKGSEHVSGDRHSHAEDAQLLSDPDEIARREAENGLRQFTVALEMIRSYVICRPQH
jgi:hypothetical protein